MKFSSRKQLLSSADAELNRMRKLAGLNESLNEAPTSGLAGLQKISKFADNVNGIFDNLMDKTDSYADQVQTIWESVIDSLSLEGKTVGSVSAFQKGKGVTVNDQEINSAKILSVGDPDVTFVFASKRSMAMIDYNFKLLAFCKCPISVKSGSGKTMTLTLFYRAGDQKITISRNRNIGGFGE